MSISQIDIIERLIIERILKAAIDASMKVTVSDGEDETLVDSSDLKEIGYHVGSSDETIIKLTDDALPGASKRVGWMLFIHGNGIDVLSDYSANARTESLADLVADIE